MYDASSGKFVCGCGCGVEVNWPSEFRQGHAPRLPNPEKNAAISKTLSKNWEDPDFHKEHSKINSDRWTPEERKLASDRNIDAYSRIPGLLEKTKVQLQAATDKRWSRAAAHGEASETTSRVVTETWSEYTPEEKEHRLVTGILSPESLRKSQEVTRKGSSAVEDWLFWHLESDFPGIFKFNRNRDKQIGTKYPDFYSDEFKLVIESFGYAWHSFELGDDEERVEFYKTLGWTCLVIWADGDFDIDLGFPKLKSDIEKIVGKT